MAVSPIHMNDSLLILRLKYGSECTLVGHSGMNADGRLPHWAGGHPHVRSQAGVRVMPTGGQVRGREQAGWSSILLVYRVATSNGPWRGIICARSDYCRHHLSKKESP